MPTSATAAMQELSRAAVTQYYQKLGDSFPDWRRFGPLRQEFVDQEVQSELLRIKQPIRFRKYNEDIGWPEWESPWLKKPVKHLPDELFEI